MDASQLRELYAEAGSVAALARRLGLPRSTVGYRLQKEGVQVLRAGFKSPKSRSHKGPEHHNWTGGTYRHSAGYVYELAPDHPSAARAKGYVLQHRLVMERHLGRHLDDNEIVHHINGAKDDNRIENLEITSLSRHVSGHKAAAPRDERGRFAA